MSDEVRAKRLAMWREGHCCTEWWKGCPLCAARRQEIDARYPPEEK